MGWFGLREFTLVHKFMWFRVEIGRESDGIPNQEYSGRAAVGGGVRLFDREMSEKAILGRAPKDLIRKIR